MQKLHLVGFTTDNEGLILSARRGTRSGGYLLIVDESIDTAMEDLRARRLDGDVDDVDDEPPRAPRVESTLSVREIQARMRQGRSVESVAKAAGVDAAWVDRFAPPILAERAQVIAKVRATPLLRSRLGASALPIGEAVRQHVGDRDVTLSADEFDAAWTARQVRDGRWAVRFSFVYRGKNQVLQFQYDESARTVTAADRLSGQMGYVTPVARSSAGTRRSTGASSAGRPTVARARVSTKFRPTPRKAMSRSAKERARAEAAMRKAAAERAAAAAARRRLAAKEAREVAAKKAAAERAKIAAAKSREVAAKKAAAQKAKVAAARAREAAATKAAAAKAREVAAKKAAAEKKAVAKKAVAKKAVAKKAVAKKAVAKKAPVKKGLVRPAARPPAPVARSATPRPRPTSPVPAPRPVAAPAPPRVAPAPARRTSPLVSHASTSPAGAEPASRSEPRPLFRPGLAEQAVRDRAVSERIAHMRPAEIAAAAPAAPPSSSNGDGERPSLRPNPGRPRRTRQLRAT